VSRPSAPPPPDRELGAGGKHFGSAASSHDSEIEARARAIAANSAQALLGELPTEPVLAGSIVHSERILRELEIAKQERQLWQVA
jgi:hypothetical protein